MELQSPVVLVRYQLKQGPCVVNLFLFTLGKAMIFLSVRFW